MAEINIQNSVYETIAPNLQLALTPIDIATGKLFRYVILSDMVYFSFIDSHWSLFEWGFKLDMNYRISICIIDNVRDLFRLLDKLARQWRSTFHEVTIYQT